jgi:hypothetical protein
MRLVVHIGTEKTGTSATQYFLYRNKHRLLCNRIALSKVSGYPRNWAAAAYCLPYQGNESYFNRRSITSPIQLEKYFEFFEEKLHNEIDDAVNSADTFILTSEHFHSKLTDINSIEKLRSLVGKKFSRIDIICYFREQSELARGSYFTSIVHGDYYDLDSHIQYVRPSNHYYNYFEMFSKWESVFGKESLYPRIYDRRNLYGHCSDMR